MNPNQFERELERRVEQRTAELGIRGYFVKPPTPEMVRGAISSVLPLEDAQG